VSTERIGRPEIANDLLELFWLSDHNGENASHGAAKESATSKLATDRGFHDVKTKV